jgi:hypothetical protein
MHPLRGHRMGVLQSGNIGTVLSRPPITLSAALRGTGRLGMEASIESQLVVPPPLGRPCPWSTSAVAAEDGSHRGLSSLPSHGQPRFG